MVERALLRVLHDGEPVGMGFLVGHDLALTCAHVVTSDEFEVDFPIAGGTARARVVHRAEGVDLVGLELDRTPEGARAVHVVAVDDVRDHRVRTLGVPDGRPHGLWSRGVVRGAIGGGRLHVEDDAAHGVPMLRGFSGGPVIDDDLGAVIGMVVEVDALQGQRIGYALSGATLHDAWPALATGRPNPFRGLEPFRPEDAEVFFGRARQAVDLREQLDLDGVLVVTGPSGCGKSSLVLAGLLPGLGEHAVVRPAAGGSPWSALATALGVDEVPPDRVEDVVARRAARADPRRFTLVVDQFDEALARFPEASADLLAALLDVAEAHHRAPRVDLVVTTTGGPLDHLLADPRLGPRLARRTATLGTPDPDELREVVEGPLRPPGTPVLEPGLVDVLLADVGRNPLPLLEFTLTLLWERQERGVLTHAAYRELGGVGGAVSTYAERVWRRFDPEEVRRALVQLVSPLPDGGFVRRVAPAGQVGPLAAELARTRLVTLGPDGVELAHEALVRHWDRLRDWVEEARAFRLWQDELDRQAARWEETRERGLLPRGKDLRRARRQAHELTERQRRFVGAGTRGLVRRVGVRTAVVVLVVGLVASLGYLVPRFAGQRDEAGANSAADVLAGRDAAVTPFAERLDNTLRAQLTADRLDTREDLYVLSRALRHAEVVLPGFATPNPGGNRVLLSGNGGTAELLDLTTSPPTRVAVPDVDSIVTWVGDDVFAERTPDSIRLRSGRTGHVLRVLGARARTVLADPTGRWLAHTDGGPEVRVVDLASGAGTTLTAPGDQVRPVDLLPTGEVLFHNGSGYGVLSATGARDLPDAEIGVVAAWSEPVAFRCDRETWSALGASTGLELARVPTAGTPCHDSATPVLSADGRAWAVRGATGSAGSELVLFGVVGGDDALGALIPDNGTIEAVALEPSGAYRLLVGYPDASLVFRAPPPDALDRSIRQAGRVRATPDGAHVLTSEPNGRIEVWRTADRTLVAHLDGGDSRYRTGYGGPGLLVSPDSRTLLVNSPANLVVRNLPDLALLADLGSGTGDASFLDGDRVVVWRDTALHVLAARSGLPLGPPFELEHSPDSVAAAGDVLLVVASAYRLLRRSVSGGREIGSAIAFSDEFTSVGGLAVHRGGEVAAVVHDGVVRVFDLVRGEQVGTFPVPTDSDVDRLRFRDDPDELEITLTGPNGVGITQLWRLRAWWGDAPVENLGGPVEPVVVADDHPRSLEPGDPRAWRARICALVGRSGLELDPGEPPTGAFEGDVCGGAK
ncbi:trypsin-like peptidase domain-containing protein [Saccharothrix xinjiangensis]|uniref:Trypsin-like peptidase domain-containing protein n=1 Tax=Saccharothrix xinjiangensis TaxID=204798 RepID=A0ABV9Y4C4_9PSEU